MINKNFVASKKSGFTGVRKKELLHLISASAVLRNDDAFNKLITIAKSKRIPFAEIYEALLQIYLFAGYPSAILALKQLKENYPVKRLSKAADMNLYHFRKSGINNCKKVYGEKSEKLISNIKEFSPDLAEWLVLEGYGKVLGREGLSFKQRELCVVAVLSVLGFEDQLYSHINGAFRARASIEEIRNVIETLSLFGKQSITKFGLKVLKRFERAKGIRQ
jgi:4-carboxymuconolactone decarboxylase